jgi:hypothetical protein
VKFVATKKCLTKKNFSPLSFLHVFGSGIRDPGWVKIRIRDPGSGINIPDPQHCQDHRISTSEKTAFNITDIISLAPEKCTYMNDRTRRIRFDNVEEIHDQTKL